MRIFVASWFFPPATSSEGIVTYKLLRNSKHQYDVCSSTSKQWGYKSTIHMDADNIKQFCVETDDIETWVEKAVEIFAENHAKEPYDAIMTRSMPPESVDVARLIKKTNPNIPWIASLADPIAKEAYQVKGWILDTEALREDEKIQFHEALKSGCDAWKNHPFEGVRRMCELKEIEDYAISNADALIFPCDTLKSYVLGSRRRKNTITVPHSFDRSLVPAPVKKETSQEEKITLAFLGHSDATRSLEPVVRACQLLRSTDNHALDNLKIRIIGHVPDDVRALVYNYYLYDCISIEESVDYLTSLKVMQESDWLLHIDAYFDFLEDTGGSIYFAGKIADYMATKAPILSITGCNSPAYNITKQAGGICCDPNDIGGIAQALADIATNNAHAEANLEFRAKYDAATVAIDYDRRIEEVASPLTQSFTRTEWPQIAEGDPSAQKLLSICIPSYKVECYLDRCLYSMITSGIADKLEIFVVNDGSPDSSREIGLAYQNHYPGIVHLIDKENGGHGSTINAAISAATGLYFRVVDGDDWVDGKSLAKLLNNITQKEAFADLISSNYYQVFCESGELVPWTKKAAFEDYRLYDFSSTDFSTEYFTIHSIMIKTDILKKAEFKIQEHTFYVDVEYGLFPIPYVDTVMFAPEYVYRYAVGNAEQSINPENFVKRYDHHDRVIRRMLNYLEDNRSIMSKGQVDYIESLFVNHFLRTHYQLSLVWDADEARGFSRAKDFDLFLKKLNPSLRRRALKRYRAIRQASRRGFNPGITPKLKTIEHGSMTAIRPLIGRAARRFARTSVGRNLAQNESLKRFVKRHI